MKRLNMIFFIMTLFTCNVAYGNETTKPLDQNITKDAVSNLVFMFPVNVANDSINLSIELPKNFKKISPANPSFWEFIPTSDKDPYAWSEIITLNSYIGKKINAKDLIKQMTKRFQQLAKDVKVLDENYEAHANYQEGTLLIVYTNKERRELLRMLVASGPYDAVAVQDCILIKSDDDIKVGKQKLANFFKNNVKMMDGKLGN